MSFEWEPRGGCSCPPLDTPEAFFFFSSGDGGRWRKVEDIFGCEAIFLGRKVEEAAYSDVTLSL